MQPSAAPANHIRFTAKTDIRRIYVRHRRQSCRQSGLAFTAAFDAGEIVICRQLRRRQVLSFFEQPPRCLVGMEACASASYWARKIAGMVTMIMGVTGAEAR